MFHYFDLRKQLMSNLLEHSFSLLLRIRLLYRTFVFHSFNVNLFLHCRKSRLELFFPSKIYGLFLELAVRNTLKIFTSRYLTFFLYHIILLKRSQPYFPRYMADCFLIILLLLELFRALSRDLAILLDPTPSRTIQRFISDFVDVVVRQC
jgi:hypothetical protein